jgi:hypothetical protein
MPVRARKTKSQIRISKTTAMKQKYTFFNCPTVHLFTWRDLAQFIIYHSDSYVRTFGRQFKPKHLWNKNNSGNFFATFKTAASWAKHFQTEKKYSERNKWRQQYTEENPKYGTEKFIIKNNSYLCDALSKLIFTDSLSLVGRVTWGTSLHKPVSPVKIN